MKLHTLKKAPGSTTSPKRKGRGMASGMGKTATRGHKGQWARSGGGVRRGFEGGQMPLARRLPKRGFNNIFAKKFAQLNVKDLNVFNDGDVVDLETVCQRGLSSKSMDGLRILGNGTLEKKLTVKAAGFTASAKEKIEAAGGKAEVIGS